MKIQMIVLLLSMTLLGAGCKKSEPPAETSMPTMTQESEPAQTTPPAETAPAATPERR